MKKDRDATITYIVPDFVHIRMPTSFLVEQYKSLHKKNHKKHTLQYEHKQASRVTVDKAAVIYKPTAVAEELC